MTARLLRLWPCLAALLTLGLPALTHAATLSVPSAACPTIQSGVDAAHDGDTVLVADGTYTGNGNRDIDFHGKSITVTSQNGPAKTIIDCGGSSIPEHRGFYFHSGETEAAVVNGITVTNGFHDIAGGMLVDHSSPTIITCIFRDNTCYSEGDGGGGILAAYSDLTIRNCTFSGNTAGHGGGGGVLVEYGFPEVTNCTFIDNSAYSGGGIYVSSSDATITNCTFNRNSYGALTGYFYNHSTLVVNCILYGDLNGELQLPYSAPAFDHCDIQGGYPGTSNIDKDPQFVNAATGDLHLKSNSSCLGKGTPVGAPATDLDGRARPSRPSIGAYELGTTLNVPSQYPTIQAAIDSTRSGDTVLVADGTYTGNGNRDLDLKGKNITVESMNGAVKTIIDCGGYASTDGSGNHRGFYIHSGETNAMISGFMVKHGYEQNLGGASDGAGLLIVESTASIRNCTFTANTTDQIGGGVYADNFNSVAAITLTNCTISGNFAALGGGIFTSGDTTLTNCTIAGNTATKYGGGGIYNNHYDGGMTTLNNCAIMGNTAVEGGGIYSYQYGGGTTTINSCIITGNNTAKSGGGIANNNYGGGMTALTNCTIAGNTTTYDGYYGGGISNVDINGTTTVTNCTIAGNTATYGGGIANTDGLTGGTATLTNDIIYGDVGGEVYDYYGTIAASFSDIKGGNPGTSNIDADPLFVNAATGDLHLKPGSPCLGKGTSTGAPATDLDGTPRPNPPSMGAYELGNAAQPTLTLSLSPSKATIHRNETFTLSGSVHDLTDVAALSATIKAMLPQGLVYVSSTGINYNATDNTLAWTGSLPAHNGVHSFHIVLKASADAPLQTPLTIAASASCEGFQTASQTTSVQVAAATVPTSVEVDDSGGYGLVSGTAQVETSKGTPPLYATLSPTSDLHNIWLGIDYNNGNGGATVHPTTDLAPDKIGGTILAQAGLIGPDYGAKPTYDAQFPTVGSSVTIAVRMTDEAGLMNIAQISLTLLGGILGYGPPDTTAEAKALGLIKSIPAFSKAASEFSPAPKSKVQAVQAAYRALDDIVNMNDKEAEQLAILISQVYGKNVTKAKTKRLLKVLTRLEALRDLINVLADELTLVIQTGGDDMVVQFTAASGQANSQVGSDTSSRPGLKAANSKRSSAIRQ